MDFKNAIILMEKGKILIGPCKTHYKWNKEHKQLEFYHNKIWKKSKTLLSTHLKYCTWKVFVKKITSLSDKIIKSNHRADYLYPQCVKEANQRMKQAIKDNAHKEMSKEILLDAMKVIYGDKLLSKEGKSID